MKNSLFTRIIAFSFLSMFTLFSCQKENNIVETNNLKEESTPFVPSVPITVLPGGILEFTSEDDFYCTLQEINESDFISVGLWEDEINFSSHRKAFYDVMLAEEAIEKRIISLPKNEQKEYLNQPEIHSDIYNEYLEKGLIKIVKASSDEVGYFDYGVVDPAVAALINHDGIVKIENKIYKYTSNAVKIILDGDFSKLSSLDRINEITLTDEFAVFYPKTEGVSFRSVSANNFSNDENVGFTFEDNNKKRFRFFVVGTSADYGNFPSSACTNALLCTFNLRTEAQQKNIWGNFKFNSSFSPSCTISNGTYNYIVGRYNAPQCGLCSDSGCYNQTSGFNGACSHATNPYTNTWPATNNGFFCMPPHTSGYWIVNSNYFSTSFNVFYNLPVTYNGSSKTFTH